MLRQRLGELVISKSMVMSPRDVSRRRDIVVCFDLI